MEPSIEEKPTVVQMNESAEVNASPTEQLQKAEGETANAATVVAHTDAIKIETTVSKEETTDKLNAEKESLESGDLFSDGSGNDMADDDGLSDSDEDVNKSESTQELSLPNTSEIADETPKKAKLESIRVEQQQQQQRVMPKLDSFNAASSGESLNTHYLWARPRVADDRKLCPVKVPASLHIETTPFVDAIERRRRTNAPLDVEHTIRFRFKKSETDEVLKDENGNPLHESNSKFIEWSDGSWTLAIGSTHYECIRQSDRSLIMDNSNSDTLICCGMASEKMTLRPLSTSGGHLTTGGSNRQRDTGLIGKTIHQQSKTLMEDKKKDFRIQRR